MTFTHRFTHYFVEFCRDRRLRTFLKVVQKNLQHTCLKRGRGGGQRPFKQCLKKLHNWFGMASLTGAGFQFFHPRETGFPQLDQLILCEWCRAGRRIIVESEVTELNSCLHKMIKLPSKVLNSHSPVSVLKPLELIPNDALKKKNEYNSDEEGSYV